MEGAYAPSIYKNYKEVPIMGSQIKIFIDRDKLLKKVYLRDKYEIVSRQNVDDTVFNEFVYTLLNYDKESELEDE